MVNNSTNINKTNYHLSSHFFEYKKKTKKPWHMELEIQVLS